MTHPRDEFTSTTDGAAGFERLHGPNYDDVDDGTPTRAEAEQDEREDQQWLAQQRQWRAQQREAHPPSEH